MSDPTLKRASVTISFTDSRGYKSQVNYSNIGRMGKPLAPQTPMIEALAELARLTALFGFNDEAAAAFDKARKDVADCRALLQPEQKP